MLAILNILPGVINYPTFFRHSRSIDHSLFALTLITLFISIFEISSIWMILSGFHKSALLSQVIPLVFFIVLTLTNCNLLNIYLASAAWEAIVPRFSGAKGYAIIGLLGTLVYTFFQILDPIKFLGDVTNSYIAILGLVLMLAFLLKIVVKHRPRPFDKLVNIITWIFGCVASTIYEINYPLQGIDALVTGLKFSVLFFLVVLFVEEIVWATKKKALNRIKAKQ